MSASLDDLPLRPDLRGLTPYGAPQAPLPVAAPPDPAALLEQIRRTARESGTASVDVLPLRDAERAHWLDRVHERVAGGDIAAARALVESALAALPDDPELLQEAAELALLDSDWEQAIGLAGRSYEVGPRQGELCRRNWLTVAAARAVLGEGRFGQTEREQLALCSPPPPVRM